jgi:hypothetical protein
VSRFQPRPFHNNIFQLRPSTLRLPSTFDKTSRSAFTHRSVHSSPLPLLPIRLRRRLHLNLTEDPRSTIHVERRASRPATPKLAPPHLTVDHRPHRQADKLLCPAHTWPNPLLRNTSHLLVSVFAPGQEAHSRDELLEILHPSLWRLIASK